MFNFIVSLLSDFFQALTVETRISSFVELLHCMYKRKKNIIFIAENVQNTSSLCHFLLMLNAQGPVCVQISFISGLLQVIELQVAKMDLWNQKVETKIARTQNWKIGINSRDSAIWNLLWQTESPPQHYGEDRLNSLLPTFSSLPSCLPPSSSASLPPSLLPLSFSPSFPSLLPSFPRANLRLSLFPQLLSLLYLLILCYSLLTLRNLHLPMFLFLFFYHVFDLVKILPHSWHFGGCFLPILLSRRTFFFQEDF